VLIWSWSAGLVYKPFFATCQTRVKEGFLMFDNTAQAEGDAQL